jgi:DHA2 family multidrug resistance protein-like MFS transporter
VGAPETDEKGAPSAQTRDWVGLGLLAIPCMLVSVNSNLLNLALPFLAADLRPSTSELLWISDIYVFLSACLLLPMGVLADRFGRRRLLLSGAAVFGLASLCAMVAGNPGTLILFRALIGVGAAMLAPSTISLIRSMFLVPRQLGIALGIWTASFALGGILGPLMGGVLIETVSWRAVFAVTPPVMVVLLVLGPFLLPEFRSERRTRIDVLGVVMAIAGILGATYGIKQLGAQASPLASVPVGIAAAVLLVAFVRRQGRIADPVLDLDLLRTRAFTVPQLGNALAFAVLYGTQLLIGQYLQSVLGMSPLEAGVVTIPSAVAYAAGGVIAPRLGTRWGAPRVLSLGLLVSAGGFAALGAIGTSTGLLIFVLGSVVYSVGLAPVYQTATTSAVSAVPEDRAGVAGATLETTTNLGGAVGIAVFGSLAGAVYRRSMAGFDVSTQSIGDVMVDVAGLAPAQAASVLAAAQAAFVSGFQLVAVSGAVLLAVVAALTPRLLRRHDR